MTIAGKRYRLEVRSWDDLIALKGPRVNGVLPAGTSLFAPGLREIVEATIRRYDEARRDASEMIRQRVRDGTAGIGPPRPDIAPASDPRDEDDGETLAPGDYRYVRIP